jgi:hypothetical protein
MKGVPFLLDRPAVLPYTSRHGQDEQFQFQIKVLSALASPFPCRFDIIIDLEPE